MSPLTFPSPDAVFGAANSLALLGWIALAASPARVRWAGGARLFAGRVVPAVLAVAYVVLFARNGLADGGYGTLAEVRRLFAVPELLTAGWLHFLAFDLFVGAWIAERFAVLGLPHALLLPLLALTFLFGPAGLLGFLVLQALRWWRGRGPAGLGLARIASELLRRERRLALFGFTLLALLLPMGLAWGLDERTLRGADVWLKPMKFALSLGLFALTTAWFIGHLAPAARRLRTVHGLVWVLIGSASFELAYITLQAGLGRASHFNVGDAFHATMYSLMGLGALALTATQLALAGLLLRHADPHRPPAYRLAVLIGLVLTFVLGAGVGGLLSGLQPPEAAALPLVGWSMAGGDLRPAHFLGIHAQQAIPLLGLAVAGWPEAAARRTVWAATAAYGLLFGAAVAWGLAGRL